MSKAHKFGIFGRCWAMGTVFSLGALDLKGCSLLLLKNKTPVPISHVQLLSTGVFYVLWIANPKEDGYSTGVEPGRVVTSVRAFEDQWVGINTHYRGASTDSFQPLGFINVFWS